MSAAGAQALPFHFNTCPDVAPVFTSDKSVNDAAPIRTSALASALAFVKYKFEPSVKFAVVFVASLLSKSVFDVLHQASPRPTPRTSPWWPSCWT